MQSTRPSAPFLYFIHILLLCSYFATTAFSQSKKPISELTKSDLQSILDNHRNEYKNGKVADYIPELTKTNAAALAISVMKPDHSVINVGDSLQKFTIQSISKTIALMIAVQERGEKEIFSKMGYYGTEKPFNHFGNLETLGIPLNPMMNAGAILTTSLIEGDADVPYQKILQMIRFITKNPAIDINSSVFESEKATGHRNRGMFYLMKNNGLIEGDEEKLDNYFRQCSIEITTEDLAKIAYFFAHHGVRFDGDSTHEDEQLFELILSQMMVAGMYEFSGEYARKIGIPSKSGVGGGIIASVPHSAGIAVFSPALDAHGNSLAGFQMLLELTKNYDLNIFN